MPVRSLQFTDTIGRASFGLGQVTVNLALSLNALNADAQIWCFDSEEEIQWAVHQTGLDRNRVRRFHQWSWSKQGFSWELYAAAKTEVKKFDILHQHGIWTTCSCTSNRLRAIHGIPTVIAPHGSLEAWALSRSPWKKRIAWMIYEKENLHRADCLHATSEAEMSDFRTFGLSNPIALIPNGISDRWLESSGDGQKFRERYSIHPDRRILLFMSRITPKKGLPILLEAIHNIKNKFDEWILVIAGADEFGHLKKVESLLDRLNLRESAIITGPLYGQAKRDAFAASDAFVLPSYSEGSPMVVLDSLGAGLPVIATKGTPWKSLRTDQCGWWVDASAEGIMDALDDVTNLAPDQLREMGRRGKDLVRDQYRWSMQALKTVRLYEWLLGRNDKPEFVITN